MSTPRRGQVGDHRSFLYLKEKLRNDYLITLKSEANGAKEYYEPVLFSQNLCCTDQIWNREIQIKRTSSEQRRLSVVICAHRQYLRTMNEWKIKKIY